MESSIENYQNCPSTKIAVYLDGELDGSEELLFEQHLGSCADCLNELNSQKRLFSTLSDAFSERDNVAIPSDFAKAVAVRAESNVSGFRLAGERRTAFIIVGVLLVIAVAVLGGSFGAVFGLLGPLTEKAGVVLGYFGHTAYDLITGAAVISRTLTRQLVVSPYFSVLLMPIALGCLLIGLFRYSFRSGR